MAFRDWKTPKSQAAIVEEKTLPISPTIAAIATIAEVESSKLAANDHYENIVVTHSPTANRYAHLITCQQCEHLAFTGHCIVKPIRPLPDAMRDCASFEKISGERTPIENTPYTQSGLNAALNVYEKKLFSHLLECKQCDFEAARYCAEVFTTGSSYDALLLVFDDAASKREALLNTVIRARISGRSVFGVAK